MSLPLVAVLLITLYEHPNHPFLGTIFDCSAALIMLKMFAQNHWHQLAYHLHLLRNYTQVLLNCDNPKIHWFLNLMLKGVDLCLGLLFESLLISSPLP